jgi:stringent starvation protein B
MAEISTKPYLVRALYEWCADNGYRPYIAVAVDERTVVPREFVRNGEIVLNISAAATNRLVIGNELLEFEARFSGVARQVSIPIENVSAIFAQENGHGMAFEVPKAPVATPGAAPASGDAGAGDAGAGDVSAVDGSGATAPSDEGHDTGGATAPSGNRTRRRPKLAAVPVPGEPAAKSARRKPQIAAVPAATKKRPSDAATGSGETPGDDDPGPGATPSGRSHLKRVK